MELQELKQELKTAAVKNGLCASWQKMLDHTKDKDTLVQMYMKGIDFCFSNNYPSARYIEEHFKGICEKYGVYVNESTELHNIRKLAFIGKSSGKITYDNYEVAQVFAKDNSELAIYATGHAIITVDCFDSSIIEAEARNHAQIIINRYIGAEVSTKTDDTGVVKIIERRFKTYQ